MRSRKSPTSAVAEKRIGPTQDAIKIGVHFAPLQTVAEAHRPVAGSASGSRSAADRRKREQSAFHFHTEEPELHPGRSHFGLRLNQLRDGVMRALTAPFCLAGSGHVAFLGVVSKNKPFRGFPRQGMPLIQRVKVPAELACQHMGRNGNDK